MTEQIQQERPPLIANGVVPINPVFFFDVDGDNYDLDDVHSFCNSYTRSEYDIYRTKHGYHIVAECTSYNEVQHFLDLTKIVFSKSDYLRDIDKLRIRVSAKWDYYTGLVVSPEPVLFECHCHSVHEEKRIGELVIYGTRE